MAKSDSEALLSEIAKRLRSVCCNTASTGGAIVQNYQPLDCNGDPVGTPIDVMATISVAKQDVAICNYQQVADAITGLYNVSDLIVVPISSAFDLADLGLDVTKLHSLSFTVLTGTVSISGTLGGGVQSATALPVGVSSSWIASTIFGTGDITFTTDGTGTVLITAISKV